MTKDLDKKVVHAMELHYERGFIDGMQKQMQSSVDKAVNRMAQTQEPVPPPWWTAVENILNEYGLQAIDFVADFKQALAQTQEPVAWPCLIDSADFSKNTITLVMQCDDYKVSAGTHWLSTTPPQRTWVGLTRDEQSFVYSNLHNATSREDSFWVDFANAIEKALKEKNHG